ncbi:hypothetical protein IMZ48_31415 [Candidatus Bathyarchaeota archaeon]|nr:hypothetical protein [Candidatus Bathyarchaeota archaeon]
MPRGDFVDPPPVSSRPHPPLEMGARGLQNKGELGLVKGRSTLANTIKSIENTDQLYVLFILSV